MLAFGVVRCGNGRATATQPEEVQVPGGPQGVFDEQKGRASSRDAPPTALVHSRVERLEERGRFG
eukprot:9659911-Alexandrium_andersonii.AAC.1